MIKQQQSRLKLLVSAGLLALLAGCGGEASSASPLDNSGTPTTPDPTDPTDPVDPVDPTTPTDTNASPVANAGQDQRALAGTTVHLPGSGQDADGSIASYEWTQVDGTNAIINNTTAATTTVTLPSVTTSEVLSFSLTVTDNQGASDTDSVDLTLFVDASTVDNSVPLANAGVDQVVSTGDSVLLSGSGDDLDGVIESYAWTQTDGVSVTLTDANTSMPSFTAPTVNGQATLTFALKVTDDKGATASDDVDVEVFSPMAPPENVQAVATPGTITVSWDAVPGAETYNLYYAQESLNDDIANYKTYLQGTLEAGLDALTFELDSPASITEFYFVVTAMRAGDESDGSAEINATSEVGIVVGATKLLNDTGFDTCATETVSGRICPIDSFKRQDGAIGRDSAAKAGNLEKVGSGRASFDFLKVDSKGKPLAAAAESWDCVFDNRTGLLWEVKKASGGSDVRSTASKFTWYMADSSINGGNAGTETGGTSCNINGDCNTTTYIEAVNAKNLCGYSNWRLPTVMELSSIIDHGAVQPAIDINFFPLTQTLLAYWTQTVYAKGEDVWAVEFNTGTVGRRSPAGEAYVRLVVNELPEEN
ncbi:MAG: DUF1566 domain-containing protein [Oceanobacter sp.]